MSANDRQVGGNHYSAPIQHWDLVVANNIPYLDAQILRYVMRWRKKNGIQDLRKAQHYLEKLIEVEEAIPTLTQQSPLDWGHEPGAGYVDPDRTTQGEAQGRSLLNSPSFVGTEQMGR